MVEDKAVVAIVHRDEVPDKPSKYTKNTLNVIVDMVKECFDLTGGVKKLIKPGQTVLLKPNIVAAGANPDDAATTDPRVLEATITYIKGSVENVKVQVGETPYGLKGASRKGLGPGSRMGDIVRRAGGEVVYFDEEPRVTVNLPNAKTFWEFSVPQALMDCDVYIQMPKLKAHMIAQVTHTLKNAMGLLTREDMIPYHNTSLFQRIVDVNKARKPDFTIMDGILTLTYDHYSGCPEHKVTCNMLIAGKDAVAVDSVTQYLVGWDNPAKEVRITRIAQHDGLGVADLNRIEVRGADPKKLRKNLLTPWDPQTRTGYSAYSYEPVPIEGMFEGVEVFMGGCCTGCQALIREALDGAYLSGALKKIIDVAGRINIIVGRNVKINPAMLPLQGVTIVYGDCAGDWAKVVEGWTDRPTKYVPGCNPDFDALGAFFHRLSATRDSKQAVDR